MSDKEIIVTNGYFNNIRLFGGKTTFPALTKVKRDDPPYVPPYGLRLYFSQWDEVGHPIDGNIGNYRTTSPEHIPQLESAGRFSSNPVVFSQNDLSGKTFLDVISDLLPGKAIPPGDITEPEFQGFVPGDPGDPDAEPPIPSTPPYNPPDSPYLMNLTLGTTDPPENYDPENNFDPNVKVRYTGHENTTYEFTPEGTIIVHWEGESWMYYVGVPNPNIPGNMPIGGPADPAYPSYPTRLIYQFVFTEPKDNTSNESVPYPYPGTDDGDDDPDENKWITTSKLEQFSGNLYLPITLSWERLAFDYEVRTREVKGVNQPVIVIKNLKRLGK
jgi:hypothetical protein